MTAGVTMRSSKGRTVLYVLVGCSIAFLVYILSSTHNKLKSTEESNDKCQQQRDSLSAQLQVLYEHKSRLEKSLQNEMAERKKVESEVKSYKEEVERTKMEYQGRYSDLQQKYEEVKKNNLEDFNNLKGSYASLVGDKEKLEADMGKYVSALEQEKSNEAKLQEHIKELTTSLRMAEAALEQEKAKYNAAQSQLDTCQAVRLQLAAQVAQGNVVAAKPIAYSPVALKSVMKEEREVPAAPKGISLPTGNIARPNVVQDKGVAAAKEEVLLSQSKDEKQTGGAMGPIEKVRQKPQPQVQAENNSAFLQVPHMINKLADARARGKSVSPPAAEPKLEQAPVAAVPPPAGAAVGNRSSPSGNAADQNQAHQQAAPLQDSGGPALNYQVAPPHDQAPPPPPPAGELQEQQSPERGFLGLAEAEKPQNVAQEASRKENPQQEPPAAIPAPQAADPRKEEVGDNQNVLVPPKSGEAGEGAEAAAADPGKADVGEAPKMGNLARPLVEAPQHVPARRGPMYPRLEEDNREYPEAAREDDAGDDQDADGGIFGADHRKQFQDADFDDQMVEPENQQPPNQVHGEGLMVNPK